MKQNSLFKSSRNLLLGGMLGALLPLSAAYGLDTQYQDSDVRRQDAIGQTQDVPATGSQYDDQRTMPAEEARGAQGPIRSDMSNEQWAEERDRQRRMEREAAEKKDLERRLSPINGSNSS